jgi:8-oxo-dGTP pyrophosphatase MutT (NUDIX family)
LKQEKSAGIIVFRKEGNQLSYLLLHYDSGHWDFPKGHIEKDEDDIKAAKRELEEETGIKEIKIIEGFREIISYYFKDKNNNLIHKYVMFFIAETSEKKVKLSFEHKGFIWLPFKNAHERVTYKNAEELLKKADRFLMKMHKI